MKTEEVKTAKIPTVRINKKLNKYDNVVLFPEKLALANEMLAKAGVPKKK